MFNLDKEITLCFGEIYQAKSRLKKDFLTIRVDGWLIAGSKFGAKNIHNSGQWAFSAKMSYLNYFDISYEKCLKIATALNIVKFIVKFIRFDLITPRYFSRFCLFLTDLAVSDSLADWWKLAHLSSQWLCMMMNLEISLYIDLNVNKPEQHQTYQPVGLIDLYTPRS